MSELSSAGTSNFPTTAANALQFTQESKGIYGDAFVARIDTTTGGTGSLLYSSYLGGSDGETDGFAIAADSAGHAYITGETFAVTNFPITAGAFNRAILRSSRVTAATTHF